VQRIVTSLDDDPRYLSRPMAIKGERLSPSAGQQSKFTAVSKAMSVVSESFST
jgi:hypothetical protein